MKKHYLPELRVESIGFVVGFIKVHSMNRENLSRKCEKQDRNDSLTLVLTYHPALNKVHQILNKAHRYTIHSPRLLSVLPSPSRVAFRNPKTLKDFLVRSRLKIRDSNDKVNDIYIYIYIYIYRYIYICMYVCVCGNISCDICNVLYLSNEFQSTVTGKKVPHKF